MATNDVLERARAAVARLEWREARAAFTAITADVPLSLDDIEWYACAAHLIGEESECREVLSRGYREALQRSDVVRAARFAFFLGHNMIFTGENGQANGWFGRARRHLMDHGVDCAVWGYLMVPTGIEQLYGGDFTTACSTFAEALAIGRRFADSDLMAMAGHGHGRALIQLGLVREGIAALDEVMVAVTAGEVFPMLVGRVYCGVLEACQEMFDFRRAREWTSALSRWCEGQPDLVPYRGPCLVHRVEMMRLRGDWDDALREARQACSWLSDPSSPEGPGDAYYQLGELYRLRGDFQAADEAYHQASRHGRSPEPGIALLILARGEAETATSVVRRALVECGSDKVRRSALLDVLVECSLALGDTTAAHAAATELTELAKDLPPLPLQALADRAVGRVLLAQGDTRSALPLLRRSWSTWQQLDTPYEAAKVRVLIGAAYREIADEQSAAMEFDAARWVFERLGALPDVAHLNETAPSHHPSAAGSGLTQRELEVLTLISAGETNKAIAATLVISEHTVARHVQNMLQKLGFTSRTSLATFAVEQGIIRHPGGQN